MNVPKNEKLVKVVFGGETNVGKTSIVERSIFNRFGNNTPTMGAAFAAKKIFHEDKSITLGLWDTAGQERFQSMSALYFRNALICVLVFDLTNRKSFDKIPMWKNLAKDATSEFEELDHDLPIFILVGNKNDMKPKIDKSVIDDFCKNHNIHHYIETSALNGNGINKLYEIMGEEACKLNLPIERKLAIHPFPPPDNYQCPCY